MINPQTDCPLMCLKDRVNLFLKSQPNAISVLLPWNCTITVVSKETKAAQLFRAKSPNNTQYETKHLSMLSSSILLV